MWRCEDVDLQMWGCEDVDQQMWRCEDVDLQMWRCEDVDQQMWGCEDVDQQMWRCEDVLQRLLFYEEPFAGALGKKHPSYKITPCDEHSTLTTKTQIWLKPIFDAPNLPWWCQDFHQRVPQLCYREPVLAGSCLHTTRSSQGPKLISWYLRQSTTEPFLTMWNSSYALAADPTSYRPTACNTLQPQNSTHPTTLNHVTNIQLSSYPFLPHPTCVGGAKTSNNRARSSPTASHFLSGPRPTFRALAILRSSSLQCGNFFQGPLEPFTAPGQTTATQLLQPNFHGIGGRGRLLHSHGQSLQQMKQWPQCFHKCHGCATWTKHFACT